MTQNATASRQYALLTGDAPVHFDGRTYDPEIDLARLTTQLDRVRGLMWSGGWWTIPALQNAIRLTWGVRASEASISARIRDLRKNKFGGYVIERDRVDGGTFRYRLLRQEVAR